jgi:hypothetical protein
MHLMHPKPSSSTQRLLAAAFGILLIAAALTAQATTVYRWVDEKGVVNYTTVPPPTARKAATIDVSPAVAGQGDILSGEEARYWRARGEREALRDATEQRMQRETVQLQQSRARQEMALAEARSREKSQWQSAVDQCKSQRHVDCETVPYGPMYGQPVPLVIVARPGVNPFPSTGAPYFSVTPNFTPGFSKPLVYTTRQ